MTINLIGSILFAIVSLFIIRYYIANSNTDEIIIENFAARLFLEGKDPYINSLMQQVFKQFPPNPNYITPSLYGGNVNYLLYPAMSFLVFIPVVVFSLPNYYVLYFTTFLLILSTFLYLKKENLLLNSPIIILLFGVESIFFAFSVGGSTDIIWVFFVFMAFFFRKKPVISGLFFGLAISAKQLPIILLPFFLIYIFKESDLYRKHAQIRSALSFLSGTIITFFATNLPFIIMQPHDWLNNIVEAEFQPVIGIGLGFSSLSFSGFVNLSPKVFTFLFVFVFVTSVLLYILKYNELKYFLFIFPIIIFLFNYRVLMGYLVDWIGLVILSYVVFNKERNEIQDFSSDLIVQEKKSNFNYFSSIKKLLKNSNDRRHLFSTLFIILILTLAGGSGIIVIQDKYYTGNVFKINSIDAYYDNSSIPGYITQMKINISYNPLNGMKSIVPLYFRIIPDYPLNVDYNGLIWESDEPVSVGFNTIFAKPESYLYLLKQNSTFRIQPYYVVTGQYFQSSSTEMQSGSYFSNPNLTFPTNLNGEPFLDWKATMSNVSFNYGISKSICSLSFTVKSTRNGSDSFIMKDRYFNLSYLSQNNMYYRVSINGSRITNNTEYGICINVNENLNLVLINSSKSYVKLVNNYTYVYENLQNISFRALYKQISDFMKPELTTISFFFRTDLVDQYFNVSYAQTFN
ncbi:glycosyltransferase 87 family protein [Caldiplasma sukawensis]